MDNDQKILFENDRLQSITYRFTQYDLDARTMRDSELLSSTIKFRIVESKSRGTQARIKNILGLWPNIIWETHFE